MPIIHDSRGRFASSGLARGAKGALGVSGLARTKQARAQAVMDIRKSRRNGGGSGAAVAKAWVTDTKSINRDNKTWGSRIKAAGRVGQYRSAENVAARVQRRFGTDPANRGFRTAGTAAQVQSTRVLNAYKGANARRTKSNAKLAKMGKAIDNSRRRFGQEGAIARWTKAGALKVARQQRRRG